MGGLVLVIMLIIIGILCLLTWGITSLVCYIQDKRWEKWCNFVFATYPELKAMLVKYRSLRYEYANTVQDAVNLQKSIDDWVEKNNYLPHAHRVDAYIETLKQQYQDLLELRAEQSELVDKSMAELVCFWEKNFPNLRADKRIMWWSE